MALMVLSDALGSSNRTIIMVESFLPYIMFVTSPGKISFGTVTSTTSLSQKQLVTPSTASMSCFILSSSAVGISPSTVTIAVDARPKSLSRYLSPSIDSNSDGR